MKVKSAQDRIKELSHLREYEVRNVLRSEGYDVSRRFVRDQLGLSTEIKRRSGTYEQARERILAPLSEAQYRNLERDARDTAEWLRVAVSKTESTSSIAGIPENAHLLPTAPLSLNLPTWAYATDFHAPLGSKIMLERLLRTSRHRRIDTLVIGGDLFDFDSVSRHGRAERQAGLNVTLRVGGEILDLMSDYFKKIHILPGNHDRRVATKLDEPLEFEMLIRAACKRARVGAGQQIETTDYDYMYIQSGPRRWVVGHPRAYRAAAKGFAKIASIQDCSVMVSHTHQQGMAWSDCGKHIVIDPGCMADASITPYLQTTQGLSMYSAWKQGFVHVVDGVPQIMADGLVDWSMYGAH